MKTASTVKASVAIVFFIALAVSCMKDPQSINNVPLVRSLIANVKTYHSASIVAHLDNFTGVACKLIVESDPPIELPGSPDDNGYVEWELTDLSPNTSYSIVIELSVDGRSIVSTPVSFKTREKVLPPDGAVVFKDSVFEKYCLDGFDTNDDGYIAESEALQVTELIISENNIASVGGIEHFSNLTVLYCNGNCLSSLEEIKALPRLTFLDCSNNLLDSLDLSHNSETMEKVYCTPQKDGELSTLIVHCDQVIHGITDIRSSSFIHPSTRIIEAVRFQDKAFEEYCLKSFDLNRDGILTSDETENVKGLFIENMGIRSIDEIRYFHNLEVLSARGNMISGTLDVNANKRLTVLLVGGNNLSFIDLSAAKGLTSLDIEGCSVSTQMFNEDLKVLDKLTSLNCSRCGLEALDLSHQRALNSIDCSGNRLNIIDLRYNADEIAHFRCTPQDGEEVETIYIRIGQTVNGVTERRSTDSVSSETEVMTAALFEDGTFESYCLDSFDTDGDGVLSSKETEVVRVIELRNQEIVSLKGVEYFPNIVTLVCEGCCLSGELDISKNTKLETAGFARNELTGLILGYLPELEILTLFDNRVRSINLSGTPRLASLHVDYCPLGDSLNDELRKVPYLQQLGCNRCDLTELDLSGQLYLKYFSCENNRLTTLDLSYAADAVSIGSCRQRTTKEIETIYVRQGQSIQGLTDTLDESRFSPATKVVVKN